MSVRANTTPYIKDHSLDATLRQIVGAMLRSCRPQSMPSIESRGLVLDTMSDVSAQIHALFNAQQGIEALVDDIAEVTAQGAKAAAQRFVEVSFMYVADGKIPPEARKSGHNIVKWYSDNHVSGGEGQELMHTLKPGWSAGAESGVDMLEQIRLGARKGFLLVVKALDASDIRAADIKMDIGGGMHIAPAQMDAMIEAFAGAPEVMAAIKELAQAQPSAQNRAALQEVAKLAGQVKEVKTLLSAVQSAQAPETPQVVAAKMPKIEPLLSALAVKVSALPKVLEGTRHMPAPFKAAASKVVHAAQVNLSAVRIDQALHKIQAYAPPLAKGVTPAQRTTQGIVQKIKQVDVVAQSQGLSRVEAIKLVMDKQAPAPLKAPVQELAQSISAPMALPAIERALPPKESLFVREALSQNAPEALARVPIKATDVAAHISSVADKMAPSLLKEALIQTRAHALHQAKMPQVGDNLAALQASAKVPPLVKADIALAQGQASAFVAQMYSPVPPVPALKDAPAPLDAQAPLVMFAKGADVAAPPVGVAAPAPQVLKQAKSKPQVVASEAKAHSPLKAANTNVPKDAQKPAKGGPCANCKNGFNCAACAVLQAAALARLDEQIDVSAFSAKRMHKPNVA